MKKCKLKFNDRGSEFMPQSEGILVNALSKSIAENKIKVVSERDNYRRIQAERRVEDIESIGIMAHNTCTWK